MRAGQKIFFEKVPFLENKKVSENAFLRFDYLRVYSNKGIKEPIFQKKNYFYFLPLGFF